MRTEFLRAIDGSRWLKSIARSCDRAKARRVPTALFIICRVSSDEIGSWEEAHEIRLAPHFTLAELMLVDCREARLLLSQFPHYVPCAILLLARFLEDFRREVDAPVFISANGGYRSSAHEIKAQKAFMLGDGGKYLPDWRYFPVRHEVVERYRTIGQRLLGRLFLFGHSDVKRTDQRPPPHRFRIREVNSARMQRSELVSR